MCTKPACKTVKNLGSIKCHSPSSPRTIKTPSNYIRYNSEDLHLICKTCEAAFLEVINKPVIYKFFKDFRKKKINRAVVFSRKPLPNIFKYRDHICDLQASQKTRFLQTLILKSFASIYESSS